MYLLSHNEVVLYCRGVIGQLVSYWCKGEKFFFNIAIRYGIGNLVYTRIYLSMIAGVCDDVLHHLLHRHREAVRLLQGKPKISKKLILRFTTICPRNLILYSKLLYKMCQDFLDIQYVDNHTW